MFDMEKYKQDLASMSIDQIKAEIDYLISYIMSPMPEWGDRWDAAWAELDIRMTRIQ